jgi:hypothetical protein
MWSRRGDALIPVCRSKNGKVWEQCVSGVGGLNAGAQVNSMTQQHIAGRIYITISP